MHISIVYQINLNKNNNFDANFKRVEQIIEGVKVTFIQNTSEKGKPDLKV